MGILLYILARVSECAGHAPGLPTVRIFTGMGLYVLNSSLPIDSQDSADFDVGPSAVSAYSRLSYVMWHALAEFVDNSTQSKLNYDGIISGVLNDEGVPLTVEINYDRTAKTLTVKDNSIGMTKSKLIEALKVANRTADSKGRSKYGMGLKTAACWIGNLWTIRTCEWASGEEWTAEVDVDAIVEGNAKIPLTMKKVDTSQHYTEIIISDLNRQIQKRTENTIMEYLGSMYRVDIRNKNLLLLFNNNPVILPEDRTLATLDDGTQARETFSTAVGGKNVHGWFGVLKDGGRKYAGFSLLQHDRQIRGYPDGWRPKAVFGGVDDEGSNTLVAQRLVGEIVVDGFDVSHTKDAILFRGVEEEELEGFLAQKTQRLKTFATSMRKGTRGSKWSRERLQQLLQGLKQEFESPEVTDAVKEAVIPPLSVIAASNQKQVADLKDADQLITLEMGETIHVRVYLQDRTDRDPHLTIVHDAGNVLHVVINQQHPYYVGIESEERVNEIIRQYIYDAVAEYRVLQRMATQSPDAIRVVKDQYLRAKMQILASKNDEIAKSEFAKITEDLNDASAT